MAGWIVGGVALVGAALCFWLFVRHATMTSSPDQTVAAVKKGIVGGNADGLDAGVLAALAKALGEALSKVGPGLVGLLGAILLLILAGQAWRVWQITGTFGDANLAGATTAENADDAASQPAEPTETASAGASDAATAGVSEAPPK